jgi:CheY-like chemotaxis protein
MKLMVVDSASEVINALKDVFEPACRVVPFTDGAQAAAAIQTEKFGAVVLEAQPPQIDGFELARRVRGSKSNSKIPIVMVTVFYNTENMLEAFRSGVNLFLGKPVTREQVSRSFNAVHGTMLNDYRRYVRAPLRAAVRCSYKGKWEDFPAINVSTGGMLLKSAGVLDVGQELDLEFKLPQAPKPLKLHAQVVRRDATGGAGLRFLSVPTDSRDMLVRYSTTAAGMQLAN